MSDIVEIQQGEGKWVKFTVTRDGAAISLSSADFFFGIRNLDDSDYIYSVENSEVTKWDVSEAADGIVYVNIPASISKDFEVNEYPAQLRITFTNDTDVDKSQRLTVRITKAIIPYS